MTCKNAKVRDYSLDNIRFFLIFSVVFAHLLEVCAPFPGSGYIYKFIYTFHMPVFIFLFGYNLKYSPKRIIYRWCFPYVVFQTIYVIFSKTVLNNSVKIQYTTPYWLLWYILACVFYQLLFPMVDTANKRRQSAFLAVSFFAALFVGFFDIVGYFFTLSRFFVFLPFFLMGCYCQKNGILSMLSTCKKTRLIMVLISMVMIVLSVPFLLFAELPNGLLYGSYSYANCKSTMWMRAMVYVFSLSWIIFLFAGIKPYINKNIFLITSIGQNTWSIFLLHGFVVKAVPIFCPYLVSSPWRTLLFSFLILALFGNKIINRAVYYICFSWVEKFDVLNG